MAGFSGAVKSSFCLGLVAALFCFNSVAQADSWLPPKPSVTYESAVKDARFVVTASARSSSLAASQGSLEIYSAAGGWSMVWRKTLQNQLSPVTALVANGGWRVVTFDNYYSVGFGDEVIVFYDESGNLLKKYSLESLLTESELAQVSRSVSSRWWRKAVRIDESLGLLLVEIGLNSGSPTHPLVKPISFNLLDGARLSP